MVRLQQSLLVAVALLVSAVALTGAPIGQSQGAVFTSRVDTVRLAVAVRRGGEVVAGLSADDFEVFDNGVRQEIDLVAFEAASLDVVMALDLSGSVHGSTFGHLRDAGLRLTNGLAARDRAALLTFTDVITLRSDLTDDRDQILAAFALDPDVGDTAVVDAAHAAMVLGDGGIGRSLAIIFSDGADTASFLAPRDALETARHTDVVVYAVMSSGRGRDAFLEDLTQLTGGEALTVESSADLSEVFTTVVDEFRQRYLVSYTPRGVVLPGWHSVEVRVSDDRAEVSARPGYFAASDQPSR